MRKPDYHSLILHFLAIDFSQYVQNQAFIATIPQSIFIFNTLPAFPKLTSIIINDNGNVKWLYYKFNLSHRDIEDLLAELGISVSYETIRLWCNKFGSKYANRLKRKHRGYGDTFFIDEVFIRIDGKQHYLWRAVDQDGEIVDVFLQKRRDVATAKRFFKRLLKKHRDEPRKIVTDKLRSYGVAHRELIPDTIHDTSQYANNRAELSHQQTHVRERGMRLFKSMVQAQRFLCVYAAVYNLFNIGRHLVSASHY